MWCRAARASGSVLTATTTRSAPIPLVMKVFEPSTIQSDPDRVARTRGREVGTS